MKQLRFFSMVLVLSFLLGTVASAEVAHPFPDVPTDAPYADALDTLYHYGIFLGDAAGNFNPDDFISRAEFATIVCRLLDEEASAGTTNATGCTDVPSSHWAAGYIGCAVRLGIVNGNGDGTFAPEDSVTMEQAAKMLVCAWGYGEQAAAAGGWPDGYLDVAQQLKLLDGVDTPPSSRTSRATIAVMVFNAINAPLYNQEN